MTFEEWYESEKIKGLYGLDIDAMGIGAYDAAKAAWEKVVSIVQEIHCPESRGSGELSCAGCRTAVTYTPYGKCKTLAKIGYPERE